MDRLKKQKSLLFLILFFNISNIFSQIEQDLRPERYDTILVCHINFDKAISNADNYKVIRLYRDFCTFDKIKLFHYFKNVHTLTINSSALKTIPIEVLELPNLTNVEFINCPNLNYEDILNVLSKEKIKKIHLSNVKLKEIPESLFLFLELEELYLYNNNLKKLNEEIGNLKKLNILNISQNKIKRLPTSFEELKNLIYLDLSDNPIFYKLDTSQFFLFTQLTNIQILSISNTKLKIFPYFLKNLEHLYNLDIRNNPIDFLPENQDGFMALEILNVYCTKIKQVPERFKLQAGNYNGWLQYGSKSCR